MLKNIIMTKIAIKIQKRCTDDMKTLAKTEFYPKSVIRRKVGK